MSYTAVPNWLIEAMPRLTEAQIKVALAVARRTIGWQKEADVISFSQLVADTGLARAAVRDALHWLTNTAGILTRQPAPRKSFSYALTYQADIPNGRKQRSAGLNFKPHDGPAATGSEFELVRHSNQLTVRNSNQSGTPLVRISNTQKKDLIALPNGSAAAPSADAHEPVAHEPTQQPLAGLPEPPPPVTATPPAPEKSRRAKSAPPPAEVEALYAPMFDLTKSPRAGGPGIAVRKLCAQLWREFSATPVQVTAFWEWFQVFSRAAQMAAREQRPVNAPLPKQIYANWPQFLEWWRAREQDLARRAAAEQRRRAQPADEERASGELVRQLNPFRNRLTRPIPVATD